MTDEPAQEPAAPPPLPPPPPDDASAPPGDGAGDAAAEARDRRRIRVLLAIAAVLAAAAIAVFVIQRRGGGAPAAVEPTASDAGTTGGLGSAPDLPRLPKPGSGSETVAGTVVDASGEPVADVSITAELELGPGDQGAAPAADAVESVVAYAGADGTFLLEGVEAGRHRLRVEGAEIFTAEVRFVPVPSDGIRIAVARRVDVVGVVVDGGGPVAGATVTIDSDALGGRVEAITDADGSFGFDALPEGSYRVWAHQANLAARAVRVPRLGAGPFSPVTLTLEPATIVVGRVVDRATGFGIEAAVSLDETTDGSEGEPARYARSDQNGMFRIEGVPHGRWLLDGWAPGWVSTGALDVEAGRGNPALELTAGAIVEGRVIDGKGRPVRGAAVRAVGEGLLGRTMEASDAVDADRLRRFSGFAPIGGGAPALASALTSAPGDFTSDPRFIPRGELGVLLGPLPYPPPPGATVAKQATIVGGTQPQGQTPGAGTGTGAAGAAGAPAPLLAEPSYVSQRVTDADGRFRITGLEAATWQIVAVAPGMAEGRSKKLVLPLGKVVTGLEVVLSSGTYLVGTVTSADGGPVVGATVSALPRGSAVERDRVFAVTDPDGRYKLGPLVGDVSVEVRVWGHGDVHAEVTMAAPSGDFADEQLMNFELFRADATLRGRIVDGDKLPVRGAEVVVESGAARGRRAETDATGWFAIEAVPDGEARVLVDHPDFPPQSFPIDSARDGAIALVWGGAVEGVIFDHHTGEPLAGVVVVFHGPDGRVEVATGPKGELLAGPLLAGAYTLRIGVPGYLAVERAIDVTAARESGAVTVRDVRLELERGALLGGVVRDKHGVRLPGARVVISRAGGGSLEGKTDSEGEFRLRDVPTGDVVVKVDKGTLRGEKQITLRPGDEMLSFAIELL